jgi:BMFP domain-containing protein YqiC
MQRIHSKQPEAGGNESSRTPGAGFEELARQLARAVPTGVAALRSELEQSFRVLLQSQIERMQLVSRERFEVQAERLSRAQQRIAQLELRIAALEKGAEDGSAA